MQSGKPSDLCSSWIWAEHAHVSPGMWVSSLPLKCSNGGQRVDSNVFFHHSAQLVLSYKVSQGRWRSLFWLYLVVSELWRCNLLCPTSETRARDAHSTHIFYRGANLNSGPHVCATGTSHGTNPYSHTHKSEKCFQISVDIFSIFLHYEMNIRGGFPSLIHIQRTQCEKMHSERSLSQRQWSLQNCKLKTFPDTHTQKKNL